MKTFLVKECVEYGDCDFSTEGWGIYEAESLEDCKASLLRAYNEDGSVTIPDTLEYDNWVYEYSEDSEFWELLTFIEITEEYKQILIELFPEILNGISWRKGLIYGNTSILR